MDTQYNIGFICSRRQCELGRSARVAMRWIEPGSLNRIDYTFQHLENESNQIANALKKVGFMEGDIIISFLPKTPELFFMFLGILKINAIAGMLFSSFGDDALLERLREANGIVTKNNLLKKVQKILPELKKLKYIIIVDHEGDGEDKILSYQKLMRGSSDQYSIPQTKANQPSVLHYTSGSTAKPKGVLHVHGSIDSLTATAVEILQINDQEIYWCTADQGWITGTSYGIIGPWSKGVTQVHYGGGYNPQAWFTILEREKITIWYTAPTALRMLMKEEDSFFKKFSLDNLKYIFSVGEPLNPEILTWARKVLRHDIYDTWFQTETGSIMIANRPGLPIKPGSMGKPVAGISASIIGDNGEILPSGETGHLCLKPGWPSMFITYLNNHQVYQEKFRNGYYLTGDNAYQDNDGYFWFIGRSDDIINTSGHLVSPFEVESSLLEMPEIAESGVVGVPDSLLYEKVVAFIVLKKGFSWNRELELKIRLHVMNRLSSIASPSEIFIIEKLPKNRSGKIMRRVLKARYLGEDPGDISTMED